MIIFAGRKKGNISQKGFSLVEVIVGISLILVLFALAMLQAGTLDISRKQRYENIAYHAANKQMEDLRAMPFASLPASGTVSDPMLSQIPSGAGSFTVSDYPDFSGMKKMVVTITWNDGAARSTVLQTLVTDGVINP